MYPLQIRSFSQGFPHEVNVFAKQAINYVDRSLKLLLGSVLLYKVKDSFNHIKRQPEFVWQWLENSRMQEIDVRELVQWKFD